MSHKDIPELVSDVSTMADSDDEDAALSESDNSTVKEALSSSSSSSDTASHEALTPLAATGPRRMLSASQPTISSADRNKPPLNPVRGSSSRVQIGRTLAENDKLTSEAQQLRLAKMDLEDRLAVMKEMFAQPVKEILDQYTELQFGKEKADEALEQAESLRGQIADLERLRNRDNEKTERERAKAEENAMALQEKIAALQSQLAAENTARPSVDGNFSDDTFMSEDGESEKRIRHLEDQLSLINGERSQLDEQVHILRHSVKKLEAELTAAREKVITNQTFVVNDQQIKDEVEAKVAGFHAKYQEIIKHYVHQANKFEKALKKARGHADTSMTILNGLDANGLEVNDPTQMSQIVSRLKSELESCRGKNRSLRRECREMQGDGTADDDSAISNEDDHKPSSQTQNNRSILGEVCKAPTAEMGSFLTKVITEMEGAPEGDILMGDIMKELRSNGYDLDTSVTRRGIEGQVPEEAELSSFSRPGGVFIDGVADQSEQLLSRHDLSIAAGNQLSFFNQSADAMADLSNSFRNANTDFGTTQEKLSSARRVMSAMFERLKGSAALFQEIIEYMAMGNPESRDLAEKIRQMQLVWTNGIKEGEELNVVFEEAERSIIVIRDQIAVFEQSLNMTSSFILDTTRRISSGGHTTTTVHAEMNAKQTPQASATKINNCNTCSDGTVSIEQHSVEQAASALQDMVETLRSQLAESQRELSEAKEQLNELSSKAEEASAARDLALQSTNLIRRQLEEEAMATSDLKIRYDQREAEFSREKIEIEAELETKMKDLETEQERYELLEGELASLKMRWDDAQHENGSQRAKWELARQEYEDAARNWDDERQLFTDQKAELASRAVNMQTQYTDLKEQAVEEKSALMSELNALKKKLDNSQHEMHVLKTNIDKLQAESFELVDTLNRVKMDRVTEVKRMESDSKKLLAELKSTQIDRDAMMKSKDDITAKMLEMEAQREQQMQYGDAKRETLGRTLDISLIERSSRKAGQCQTHLTMAAIEIGDQEMNQLKEEVTLLRHLLRKVMSTSSYFLCEKKLVYGGEDNKENHDGKVTDAEHIDISSKAVDKLLRELKETYVMREQMVNDLNNAAKTLKTQQEANAANGGVFDPAPEFVTLPPTNTYKNAMRQDFYTLTVMTNDIVSNLKRAEICIRERTPHSLSKILEETKKLRALLHDRFQAQEQIANENIETLKYELHMFKDEKKTWFKDIEKIKQDYEKLMKAPSASGYPVERIVQELNKINSVLSSAREVPKMLATKRSEPKK